MQAQHDETGGPTAEPDATDAALDQIEQLVATDLPDLQHAAALATAWLAVTGYQPERSDNGLSDRLAYRLAGLVVALATRDTTGR